MIAGHDHDRPGRDHATGAMPCRDHHRSRPHPTGRTPRPHRDHTPDRPVATPTITTPAAAATADHDRVATGDQRPDATSRTSRDRDRRGRGRVHRPRPTDHPERTTQ